MSSKLTPAQIQDMKTAGTILARILSELKTYVQPDMNCIDIDKWVETKTYEYGASPSYYEEDVRFPGAICISVNEEFVHTPPKDRILEPGDKVAFDHTITYRGVHVDSAFTMIIGQKPTPAEKNLLSATERALYAGITAAQPGAHIGDISVAIQKVLESARLSVIKNYIGHGIGTHVHEDPEIPNFGKPGTGPIIQPGDCLCIEPMATLGKPDTKVAEDGWTVLMKDGSLSAHFEHTVLITPTGNEVLTQQPSA